MIASVAGELSDGRLSARRPFRAPHHSASMAAMVGGGHRARPGEVSMAHHGVLFLDELPEFSPAVLDSLRQPIETGESVIARANHRVTYPAAFQLVAAMNPCRCGMAGEPGHQCARGPRCVTDYQARLSGPLLDRIDLRVDVPAVTALDLIQTGASEDSATVRARVEAARALQSLRYEALGLPAGTTNARCPADRLEQAAAPDASGLKLLREAAERMRLSAAPITAFSRSPAPSPTLREPRPSAARIWPKPCPIAACRSACRRREGVAGLPPRAPPEA